MTFPLRKSLNNRTTKIRNNLGKRIAREKMPASRKVCGACENLKKFFRWPLASVIPCKFGKASVLRSCRCPRAGSRDEKSEKKVPKKFGGKEKVRIFAVPFGNGGADEG